LNADGYAILESLRAVAHERSLRSSDAEFGASCQAVKRCQHLRFSEAYADVLAQPRWSAAARFFLDDLYGPGDFSRRDAEFARVVPSLVRLFPDPIVGTVRTLGELHALSERMDSAMARACGPIGPDSALSGARYAAAWCAVGQPEARERQIDLMLTVGQALDRYTRNPLLRHSLRLMRGPAQMAGLAALQCFLETGFDTFGAMRGAAPFLALIAERERELAGRLFSGVDLDLAVRDLPGRL
jgi:hypothetical protein